MFARRLAEIILQRDCKIDRAKLVLYKLNIPYNVSIVMLNL